MYLSNKDLKLVTVRPARPFRLKAANFTSLVRNIILSCESIAYCLQEKALVTENLANGKQVPLDFANYNTDNGPSAVPEGASEFIVNQVDQAITVTDLDGNKTVINNRIVVAPPIKRINLEAEKIAKEKALTIWLKADIDVLYSRTTGRKRRPFLQCSDSKIKSKLQSYIDTEYPFYSQADIMVETKNEAVENTVERVLQAINLYESDKK